MIQAGAATGAGAGGSSGVGACGAGGEAGAGAGFKRSWSRQSASSLMSGLAEHMISAEAGISSTGPGLGGGMTPTGLW